MLVVHPNSTCDVCLENYSIGAQLPHTIPCGHVFCHSCLDSLPKPICPLCRTRFEPEDIRKLHIDRVQTMSPLTSNESSISGPDAEVSEDARRYQTDITRIVKEGAPASELRAMIDQCHIWLKSQPHDQHEDLRVCFLLLYNLTETQRKLVVETETVRTLQAECEALRTQIANDQDAAQRKYADLQRTCADEKETALAVEKSLRTHYEELNNKWQSKFDMVFTSWKRLDEELQRIKYPYVAQGSSRSAEIPNFYVPETHMDTLSADEQPVKVDGYGNTKLRNVMTNDMFHLSPLPANIPPLPSAILGFSALAEDDDDTKHARDRAKSIVCNQFVPRTSTEPIPIPKKPHAPRVSSGLAITVPKTPDHWESDTSFSGEYDVSMGSCSASPTAVAEHSIRYRPSVSPALEVKPRESSPNRQNSYSAEHREHERERDPVVQREQRRVQLNELLESPRFSSLPSNSQFQSILSSESRPSASRSYSLHSVPHTSSNLGTGTSTKPPSPFNLSQSHGNRYSTSTHTGPVISHASSAAIQLERERLRAEKERDHDRDRRLHAGSASSLRDTTNAYHRVGISGNGNGKAKSPVYV